MVRLPVLFDIYRAVGVPLGLGPMLIQSYIAPKCIEAHGSLSEPYISYQGILTGCSHARAKMQAVMLSPVRQTIARFPSTTARVLMDDASLQWHGPDVQKSEITFAAVRDLRRRLTPI
eukprot:6050944-Pyramimonas_sp.AAC.1